MVSVIERPAIEWQLNAETIRVGDETRPLLWHSHSIQGYVFDGATTRFEGTWQSQAWSEREISDCTLRIAAREALIGAYGAEQVADWAERRIAWMDYDRECSIVADDGDDPTEIDAPAVLRLTHYELSVAELTQRVERYFVSVSGCSFFHASSQVLPVVA